MRKSLFAVFAVGILLCASFTCIGVTDREEEPDDIAVSTLVAAVIITAVVAYTFGYIDGMQYDPSDAELQKLARLDAANNMTDVMSVASVFTANSNANYAQLWGMTKEHWIRQAELEAYTQWESGKTYSPNSVLAGARAFENNSVMTANAVAQINSLFDEVSSCASDWGNMGTYDGKMKAGFLLGGVQYYSEENDWDAHLVSVADMSSGTGLVYIGTVTDDVILTIDTSYGTSGYQPGYIINAGATTTISSEDRSRSYTIPAGTTQLSSLDGFVPGIYRVSDAVICGDTMSAVIGDSAATLKSGLVMHTDGTDRLAILDNGSVKVGSMTSETLAFKVVPSDTPSGEQYMLPGSVDLLPVLSAYQRLLDMLYWTSVSANNSAAAVWDIYDAADSNDLGITTLMASNVYDTVVLSKGMNKVLTLSAMQQLATYYDGNAGDLSNLEIGLYGDGMDAPFVRGSILDEYGNAVYSDVIFTPFFQSDDVTLRVSSDYTVKQNCIVAIWADGQELGSWYSGGMGADGYEMLAIEDGYTITATQLGICDDDGMHNVQSLDLKVTKVRYIQPGSADLIPLLDIQDSNTGWLQIIFIVAGLLILLGGIITRRVDFILIGAGLLVFGLFIIKPVMNWLDSVFGGLF